MIYHILAASEWAESSRKPLYAPAAFDTDGYIHCCESEQLKHVVDHFFRDQKDLTILCIDAAKLAAPVKYEDLNNEGMRFPHIYGKLNTDAVAKAVRFDPNTDANSVLNLLRIAP